MDVMLDRLRLGRCYPVHFKSPITLLIATSPIFPSLSLPEFPRQIPLSLSALAGRLWQQLPSLPAFCSELSRPVGQPTVPSLRIPRLAGPTLKWRCPRREIPDTSIPRRNAEAFTKPQAGLTGALLGRPVGCRPPPHPPKTKQKKGAGRSQQKEKQRRPISHHDSRHIHQIVADHPQNTDIDCQATGVSRREPRSP